MDFLSVDHDFNMLSLKDLLEARDLYHLNLMQKKNVVGTAVGRYLIRKSDDWPTAEHPVESRKKPKETRTLDNSEVRPYSWPCVLVFVDQWIPEGKLGIDYQDAVPNSLTMPDGKKVPVCVVETKRVAPSAVAPGNYAFSKSLIGGGNAVTTEVQGRQEVASVGCLVSDGHYVYALTNQHVTGKPGSKIFAPQNGKQKLIGVSAENSIGKVPFHEIYDTWPGKNVLVNMDIGLIQIEDINDWTAQVNGIGQLGKLADLSVENISVKLVGCPVKAFGAASGILEGEIKALFYRYKAVGGFEYVSEFLIGPRHANGVLATHHGDSGSVWCLDFGKEYPPMPLAVQWGGHEFTSMSGKEKMPFALASCLTTACRLLDVEIVPDLNVGMTDYWGPMGHYTIASRAIELLEKGPLKTFMEANRRSITFEDLDPANFKKLTLAEFVPLADVPDDVWKMGKTGGFRGLPEHPNHYIDCDKVIDNSESEWDGKTLLDLLFDKDNPEPLNKKTLQKYFDDLGDEYKNDASKRGLLPLRVQQFVSQMPGFLDNTALGYQNFLCAAGVLAHYVGDSCQPLHASYLADGDPEDVVGTDAKGKPILRAKGVHSAYETNMLNKHFADLPRLLSECEETKTKKKAWLNLSVSNGEEAAFATMQLIDYVHKKIPPKKIVAEYVKALAEDESHAKNGERLWDKFQKETLDVMSEGAYLLAQIWQSTWDQAGDKKHVPTAAISQEVLAAIYKDKTFLRSMNLDHFTLTKEREKAGTH